MTMQRLTSIRISKGTTLECGEYVHLGCGEVVRQWCIFVHCYIGYLSASEGGESVKPVVVVQATETSSAKQAYY